MTRRSEVKRLTLLGLPVEEIADRLGYKGTRQVSRIQVATGAREPRRSPMSEEERARIKHLSEVEGWPPEEIAATLGINYLTVVNHTTPGAGVEWRNIASQLSRKHKRLWRELRPDSNSKETA